MLLKADLHVHTEHSPDSRTSLPDAITAAKRAGMDFLAVTDHDVPPVDEVFSQPEREGVLLIPGVEYSTDKGHLLGLFLTVPCPAHTGRRLPFSEAAALIHGCGGVAVLAHPFQHRKEEGKLVPLVPYLDGMETWNGRANRKNPQANAQAAAFAKDYGLLPTAGSDAHLAQEIGNGTITVEAADRTLPAIRTALLDGKGWITGEEGSSLCVARSQYTKLKKTHAPPLRYGRWAAFALKCAWEDLRRTRRKGE